jgi:ADP-ribose pyrophosphatase YjhB (NUDIX family)
VATPIRIRVCLAVVEDKKILLVPHYQTDAGAVQWCIPGGAIKFGEKLTEAAVREFFKETGLHTKVVGLVNVSEVLHPEENYHSITITFSGNVVNGKLRSEANHHYGVKTPKWFSAAELITIKYHPEKAVEGALSL